ncbi:MAG: hypothetical protein H7Y59_14295 [Anaerolineales bacterium]|nr:hypothetical protein [Anaerolineales bacterium]
MPSRKSEAGQGGLISGAHADVAEAKSTHTVGTADGQARDQSADRAIDK